MENMNTNQLNAETVKSINNLLAYLHDSHRGYHESAEGVDDTSLKTKFNLAAHDREQMINKVEQFLIANNEKPVDSGTLAGSAHRVFVDLKSFIMGKDKDAILNEVIRGENFLVEKYQDALAASSDLQVNNLLKEQLDTIQNDLVKWTSLDEDR